MIETPLGIAAIDQPEETLVFARTFKLIGETAAQIAQGAKSMSNSFQQEYSNTMGRILCMCYVKSLYTINVSYFSTKGFEELVQTKSK